MLKIFEDSDVASFIYDLSIEASDVSSFQYLITNLDIIYLEYTSTLPIQLTSAEMTESNLKNYITFFKDGYTVENLNIQIYITDAYTGGKKVEYIL